MKLYDIHTHHVSHEHNDNPYHSCILNVYPLEFEAAEESCKQYAFSCGVHPWYSEDSDTQMARLSEIAGDPCIVAIGEAGLDKLKGPALAVQIPVFRKQIELSEKWRKPIIIHCVKAWEELIHIHRETKPTQPWIIHGFRSKPELTKQLVKEGFLFSLGSTINAHSVPLIPIDSLFCETDTDEINIREVYRQVAEVRKTGMEDFADAVAKNVHRVFPLLKLPKD